MHAWLARRPGDGAVADCEEATNALPPATTIGLQTRAVHVGGDVPYCFGRQRRDCVGAQPPFVNSSFTICVVPGAKHTRSRNT